ncbi:hypothetical protein V8E36_001707 [Tilletia maclaganii]
MAPIATDTAAAAAPAHHDPGPGPIPPSPSSAAILAAAKQRRLLLQSSHDPTLLNEFGPLGAPSPTKDARRRVVSSAATLSRPSQEDSAARRPGAAGFPESSSLGNGDLQAHVQSYRSVSARTTTSTPTRKRATKQGPVSVEDSEGTILPKPARSRWEEDWGGNAAAEAMGMTPAVTELIRRSSNASAQLLDANSAPSRGQGSSGGAIASSSSTSSRQPVIRQAGPSSSSQQPRATKHQQPPRGGAAAAAAAATGGGTVANGSQRNRAGERADGRPAFRQNATASSPALRQAAKSSASSAGTGITKIPTPLSTANGPGRRAGPSSIGQRPRQHEVATQQQAEQQPTSAPYHYAGPAFVAGGSTSSSSSFSGADPPSVQGSASALDTGRPRGQHLHPSSSLLTANGSEEAPSVSAPYVTHDFDEMLPPAVARRLQQQRLMAMDPRLSRVEGLIDTWDRDGLPLSLTQQQQQQQQQRQRQEQRDQQQQQQQQHPQHQAQLEKDEADRAAAKRGLEAEAEARRTQIQAQRAQAQAQARARAEGQQRDAEQSAAAASTLAITSTHGANLHPAHAGVREDGNGVARRQADAYAMQAMANGDGRHGHGQPKTHAAYPQQQQQQHRPSGGAKGAATVNGGIGESAPPTPGRVKKGKASEEGVGAGCRCIVM